MKTIGQIFREAREARGITLSQAAEGIRVKPSVIEDLEADHFSRFPAPIYARGFIKLYAEYLRLDAAPLLVLFSAYLAGTPPPDSLAIPSLESSQPERTAEKEGEVSEEKAPMAPELPLPLPKGETPDREPTTATESQPRTPTPTPVQRERVELPPRVAPIERFRASPPPVRPQSSYPSFRDTARGRLGRMSRSLAGGISGGIRSIRRWPWPQIGRGLLIAVGVLVVLGSLVGFGAAVVRKARERAARSAEWVEPAGSPVPDPEPLYLPDSFSSR
jgi:transcriptional regulator with XRE-family HTH domain